MSRAAWHAKKDSKGFYLTLYRKSVKFLLVSLGSNVALSYLAVHMFFIRPEPIYFSTNGATPPVQLTALDTANESSVALLPEDPDKSKPAAIKLIPD